jgi:DNA-directed RNA polymerase sigma subunit (sigma70/sigma32)
MSPFAVSQVLPAAHLTPDFAELINVAAPGPEPFERAESALLAETVGKLVASLPSRERDVIWYHFGFGAPALTFAELAVLLDCDERTVYKVAARALNRLRVHPQVEELRD